MILFLFTLTATDAPESVYLFMWFILECANSWEKKKEKKKREERRKYTYLFAWSRKKCFISSALFMSFLLHCIYIFYFWALRALPFLFIKIVLWLKVFSNNDCVCHFIKVLSLSHISHCFSQMLGVCTARQSLSIAIADFFFFSLFLLYTFHSEHTCK